MNSLIVHMKCITTNTLVLLLLAASGMVLYLPAARAQSGAGSIQGTVQDSTNATIPNATVHVVNQATGVTIDTHANGVGFYQVPNLFTGIYLVDITAPGMSTFKSHFWLRRLIKGTQMLRMHLSTVVQELTRTMAQTAISS